VSNPQERDDIHGTAASADAASYLKRRQGNLTRGSDGFRSPVMSPEPRRPLDGGHLVDPPLLPYAYNPRPPESARPRNTPRTWKFFRTPDLGAPRVGFPDRARTEGKLTQSGESWGHFGEPTRAIITPAVDGRNAPPSHAMGERVDGPVIPRSTGPRWRRPTTPRIFDHLPH